MKREVQINNNSYKEVTLSYRIHRAIRLDDQNMVDKENRLLCPLVEAARSTEAYGEAFIPNTKSTDLKKFADALEMRPIIVKIVAYLSGKKSSILKNILSGKFNDQEINRGFIHALKNGVNTGIYKDGKFNYNNFNTFVWFIHPQLKGIPLTNSWLYSINADYLYLEDSHLSRILDFNLSNKTSKKVGLGLKISSFEIEKLLLGFLSQDLQDHSTGKKGILIRDLHELYKYGFMPAVVEEKLMSKNLLPDL